MMLPTSCPPAYRMPGRRPTSAAELLKAALHAERDADTQCAAQAFAQASAGYSQASDLLRSRAALLREAPPLEW